MTRYPPWMRNSDFCRGVIPLCAGLAMLAGCAAPGVVPGESFVAAGAAAGPDASWIAPGAASAKLLYVSDLGTRKVNIYSYPQGKLMGALAGFKRPQAMCVDKAGDVFIPDLQAFKVYEYQHGQKKLKATLHDPGEDPGDCAVDPTTGDLAVANVSTPYSGAGDIVIYARGKRTAFSDPQIRYYTFCGYDDKGNLFLDGTSSGSFKFAELPKGKRKFVDITLDKQFRYGGAVQWDGRHVAVGDYESNAIYQFEIDGTRGTTVGETRLDGSNFAIGFWIDGSTVIGPNDDSTSVKFWNYPGGGASTKSIGGLDTPWGAVVSSAK